MSHDKFIHHETRVARNVPENDNRAGAFDVIEDETGFYVSNANMGFMGRFYSLAEGIAEAERLADKYDADHAKPFYIECGCCGHFHTPEFRGDCREDAHRFTADQLDAKHGEGGWDYADLEGQNEEFK